MSTSSARTTPRNAATCSSGPHVEGLVVVESGLKLGDKVIVNGMRKIFFPGQPVNPRDVPMDQPDLPPPAPAAAPAPAG